MTIRYPLFSIIRFSPPREAINLFVFLKLLKVRGIFVVSGHFGHADHFLFFLTTRELLYCISYLF